MTEANMDNKIFASTGDSWKELANKAKASNSKPSITVQRMVARMDEVWSFSKARGVFDNGCGPGTIISHILQAHGSQIPATATILAGDFSEPMLDVLRGKREANMTPSDDVWKRLEIRNVNALDLSSIPDDSISHITGGHLYFLLPDHRQALKETIRVLCPGGVVAMSSGKRSQHVDALHDAVEAIKPGTNLSLFNEPWCSEEGAKGELEICGFVDVETHLVESSMSYSDVNDFAEMLLTMPVMKNIISEFSNRERQQVCEHLVSNLESMNPGNEKTLTGVGIIVLGRKAS